MWIICRIHRVKPSLVSTARTDFHSFGLGSGNLGRALYIQPEDFTLRTVPARVEQRGDLFEPVLTDKQSVDHLLPVLADFGLDGRYCFVIYLFCHK